jgi:hypothetical protein
MELGSVTLKNKQSTHTKTENLFSNFDFPNDSHKSQVTVPDREEGNLDRTPDVAVVISLNNLLGPVDDTVTAQKYSQSQSQSHENDHVLTRGQNWPGRGHVKNG